MYQTEAHNLANVTLLAFTQALISGKYDRDIETWLVLIWYNYVDKV